MITYRTNAIPTPTSIKRKQKAFLSHCSISQLNKFAAEEIIQFIQAHQKQGSDYVMGAYNPVLEEFKETFAALLKTAADNIAAVKNTSEAFSMIAEGYPFKEGDEVISFVHEYPANHFPWKLQARKRGVRLKLIPNVPYIGVDKVLCGSWKLAHIEAFISERTRIIALSHVQFTSGYAADLAALGQLCKERNIDLVVDVAQSLGSIPVYPEEYNIAAVAASGWKWLLGPVGIGMFYTAPAFREKLTPVLVGAETMHQCPDYLNHDWQPHTSAKRFEYATSPVSLLKGLTKVVQEVHLKAGVPFIFKRILQLQDVFLQHLENDDFIPLIYPEKHRSGILSLYHPRAAVCANLIQDMGITCSSRGGYLRVAPHYFNSEADMKLLADTLYAFE